ncbi:MAG TPA: ABC transporter ATP-binding protein [Acidimicrobiales bacterium]|nr:ABC transporter ATP-binding protein [Acidimicrobiales bacterium]
MSDTPPRGVGERPVPQRRGPQGAQGFGPRAMLGGGGPAERSLNFGESSRRLLRELAPEHRRIALVLALGATSVALSVVGPRLLGDATNLIFGGVLGREIPAGTSRVQAIAELRRTGHATQANLLEATHTSPGGVDFHHVGQVLLTVLLVYLGSAVAGYLQARVTAMVGQRSVYRLRGKVESKLSRLPLSYFDRQPRGEILSRVTNDIDNISQTLQQTLSQIVTSLLTIVGVLVMMFLISPLLAVIALVTVPASIYVATRIGKRAQPHFLAQWATTGRLNSHIEEMYTGHSLVRVFGRRKEAEAAFAEENDALFASSFKAQFISGLIQPAMACIGNINYVAVAVVGALRVASGQLSLGAVQAFIQYSRQFSQPISQVASMANLLQSGVASSERVFALLDADEQAPDRSDATALPVVQGRVAFDHVAFSYFPDQPLIEDLSLSVDPGQTVAIVGPTGAGKTTLVNLLMRFYEVGSGRITLDGVDVASMTREELRSKTGMVLQDTWLFKGSIAENIAYGSPGATLEQVVAAARATHVDHFARTLPDGYDTVLDEEGSSVSAGERQLITIARAFLSEPAILILDEATSSVDTRTELLIQRAMTALRTGRTSFVIAHRLSTIRDADLILVMEAGKIVEHGTHESLLTAGGAYARLYAAQFSNALSGTE